MYSTVPSSKMYPSELKKKKKKNVLPSLIFFNSILICKPSLFDKVPFNEKREKAVDQL